MSATTMTRLDRALQAAAAGIYVGIAYGMTPDGRCTCSDPGGPNCKPGKHPIGHLMPNGNKNATRDPATIRRWFRQHPEGNIIWDLAAAGLAVIGPDCLDRLADFQRRGLDGTYMTVQTGSGPGHQHIIGRRPPNCPLHRMCKSGDYDLVTNGYIVAADSRTSGDYTLLTDFIPPAELDDIPDWAVAMLANDAERKQAPKRQPATNLTEGSSDAPDIGSDDDTEPSVTLHGEAIGWWDGRFTILKDETGAVDRSATMLVTAKMEARAGLTNKYTLARDLARWDILRGHRRYTDRKDAAERYLRTAEVAQEAVAAEANEPQVIFQANGTGHAGSRGPENARVAELKALLAAANERYDQLREIHVLTLRALTNPKLGAGEKITIVSMLYAADAKASGAGTDRTIAPAEVRPDGYVPVSRAELAEASGCKEDAITTRVKRAADWGLVHRRVRRRERKDTRTGDVTFVSELQLKPAKPLPDALRDVITLDPIRPPGYKGHGGARVKDDRPAICEAHPDAAVIVRHDAYCAESGCGEYLGTVRTERIDPPAIEDVKPQKAVSEDANPPTVDTVLQGRKLRFHDDLGGLCDVCRRPLRNDAERRTGVHAYDCTERTAA